MLQITTRTSAVISVQFPDKTGMEINFSVPVYEPARTHALSLIQFLNASAEIWEKEQQGK